MEKIDNEALKDSIFELIITVLVTFLAFLLLSIPFLAPVGTESSQYWHKLYSFFDSGEMALPIFSICGGIFSILALKNKWLNKIEICLTIIVGISLTLFVGITIGTTNGFLVAIPPDAVTTLTYVYGFAVINWVYILYKSKLEVSIRNSDGSARKLLDDYKAKKEN